MATKIIAIVQENYDESDLVSIVRRALLDAGMVVDSVDACSIIDQAVLYVDLGNGRRRYVLAIPSRGNHIDWTDDIDAAKVCDGMRSIEQCKREVEKRAHVAPQMLAI